MANRCWSTAKILVLLAVVLGVVAGPAGAASAKKPAPPPSTPLGCGSTITKNTVLKADITGCTGPGLIIGANGVTLDLGGHTVSGLITETVTFQCEVYDDEFGGYTECIPCDKPGYDPCGPPFATEEGFLSVEEATSPSPHPAIDNTGGFDRVTVRNGRMKGFEFGVRLSGADMFLVSGFEEDFSEGSFVNCVVCLEDSRRGRVSGIRPGSREIPAVQLTATSDTVVENADSALAVASDRNTFRGVGFVKLDEGSDHNVIEKTRFVTADVQAVAIFESSGNVVRANRFEGPEGVFLHPGADRNVIENNVFNVIYGDCAFLYSIVLFGASDNIVRRNRMSGPLCPPALGGVGFCDGASGNLIEDNDVRDSMVGINLGLDSGCPEDSAPLIDNVVRGNRITGSDGVGFLPESSGDGITVGPLAQNTLVEKNAVLRNSGNGISVVAPSTSLGRNLAVRNGGLGISAPSGTVDLGGNRASANGDPAQCTGVVCS